VFGTHPSAAQKADDCETTLNSAIEEFNAGHFSNISSLLNDCLDKFSREQRERAYLLLTQTYLLLDDPFGAEQSYLSLLKANPEFLADENRDPIDVVYLSKKFTATPIFSWYLNIGANTSVMSPLNSWSAIGSESSPKKYSLRPGLQFGGGLDYNFNDNIVIGGEVNYAFTGYKLMQSNYFNGLDQTEVVDRQNWVNIPVMAKYVSGKGKIRPYGYIGYSFNFLLSDKSAITITNRDPSASDDSQTNFFTNESPSLNYSKHRRKINRAVVFGGGIKYKIGLDYLFADARFSWGQTNIIKPESRFADMQWVTQYGYVEDDLRINNVFISIGFIRPLYKPRKLKKARTKSVLRRIGKTQSNEEAQ
jgi:hypothetical protein